MAACGSDHFRHYDIECGDGVCLRHRRYKTRGTRETVWANQRGVWTGVRDWPGGGGLAREHEFAFSFLGRSGAEPWQRAVRLFRVARISATGAARQVSLAHGESDGGAYTVAIPCGACGTFGGSHTLLPRTQLASFYVGPLYRVSLRMEPPRRWPFARRGGRLRCACVGRAGRSLCEALWRAAKPVVRLVLRDTWICGVRAGSARVDDSCRYSVHCIVGDRRSRGAVADGATCRSLVAGQVTRSDQLVARDHGDGRTGSVHADFCRGDIAAVWPKLSWRPVLSCGAAIAFQPAAGGLCDEAGQKHFVFYCCGDLRESIAACS